MQIGARCSASRALSAPYPLLFSDCLLDLAGVFLHGAFEFQAGRSDNLAGDFLGFSFNNVGSAAGGVGGTSFHPVLGVYHAGDFQLPPLPGGSKSRLPRGKI
jgi:hypothetical protein